ncbi:PKD-like family lipoprotein [Flavobacterium sp. KACC 22761]|uniref:PKD-like family lipoprotein n=1 Tax=Flavobacterium sp. KACC 22761 TaxID=3092665 RepID=UPI002A75097C|nr:PKD-like family lipoprotein [Flavobacterium sp. KACC 22761]WPO78898.1 PKD-like family lipoprotein [Flavobacterium sp. KACC 22761]
MIKKIQIKIALLLLITVANSCVSDEGNYNYTEINTLNVTGIQEEYTVYTGERFKLSPDLNPTKDDGSDPDRYTFQWVALGSARNIISTSKDIDAIIKLPPAKYQVYYLITDKVTGVTWQQKYFTLNVVSAIYEGWMVVGDVDGKARLDMVSIIPNGTTRVITDVLDAAGSALKLSGKAVDVECFGSALSTSTAYGIYVTATETGTARLEPDSFAWTESQNIAYESVGGAFETNFGVDFMKSAAPAENIIYSKGNIYCYVRSNQIRYGLPQNILDIETKPFYAAPFIAENRGTIAGPPIFYDQNNRRFVRYSFSKGNCSAMPPLTGSPTVLDWNNTNCDLVYMTTSNFNSFENFAVLKNVTTGKFHLLRFNTALAQTYYKEILNAPDIDKATKFAVSPDSGYLFYAVGGKLYEYDNGTQSAKLMLDKGSEEITYLDCNARANKLYTKKLIVGSYGTTGKLELFTVPPVNGNLVLDYSYSGLCKIVDVAYRTR